MTTYGTNKKKRGVKNTMDDLDIDEELAELDEYIDDSVKFKIKNGILYDYCGNDSEVVIPNGVEVISFRTFSGKLNLEKLIIPEGVEIISDKAFEYCFFKGSGFTTIVKKDRESLFCYL